MLVLMLILIALTSIVLIQGACLYTLSGDLKITKEALKLQTLDVNRLKIRVTGKQEPVMPTPEPAVATD